MGVKRSQNEMEGEVTNSSAFMPMFEHFRTELDEHHDRRERIIKASRDITAASKKIIYTLQRVRTLGDSLPPHVVKGNKQYYDTISTNFSAVSRDLQGLNAYRYGRNISGGCQEYMEAATFEHYLTTATLLSYEEARDGLRKLDSEGAGVELSPDDYVLGIYDMTGELMRFAITAMAATHELPSPSTSSAKNAAEPGGHGDRNVLTDMRILRSALESLDEGIGPFAKDAVKKMEVMRASVEKVEKSLYGLIVRGAERPKGWMPDSSDPGGAKTLEVES